MEAVAIILRRKDLKWFGKDGLINLAEKYGISRRLGFLLDAINFESSKHLIEEEIIKRIKENVKGRSGEMFPRDDVLLTRFQELSNKLAHQALLTKSEKEELEKISGRLESYKELSEKWGLRVILPRETIRKVLEDFGVKLAK
jgi:type I site-specific restriction-modification system R (restriction) subunit